MKLGDAMRATPEDRLLELDFELLPVPDAVADFVAHAQIADIIYASGALPWIIGGLRSAGLIGGTLTVEQGDAAFQLLALKGLSLLNCPKGDLPKIKFVRRVEGAGGVTADSDEMSRAPSGASHLRNKVFGEKGARLQMIYFNQSMPLRIAALVIFWTEVE